VATGSATGRDRPPGDRGSDLCTPFFLDLDGRIGPTITFRLAAGAACTAEVSLRPAPDGDQRVDAVVVGGPPPP